MTEKIILSIEVLEEIKKLYEEELLSDRRISKIVNYSRDIVHRVIVENGFKQIKPNKYTSITKDNLYELYVNQQMSIENISKILNVPTKIISKKLKEFNITVRVRNCKGIDINKIIDLYNSGMLLKDIAVELNISASYVSDVIKSNGIIIDKKEFHVPKEELTKLKGRGLTTKEMAEYFGCGVTTIGEKLIEYHLIPNKTKVDLDKLKVLCEQGKNINEMATELQCGRKTISRQLKYLGLSLNKDLLQKVSYNELYDKLVAKNMLIKDVAKEYNVSEGTLKRKISDLGLDITKERFKGVTEDTIRHLYFDLNMTQEEIANKLQCGRSLIAKKFKEFGIHKTFQTELISDEELIELYVNQNLPACSISEKTGVKADSIRSKIFNLQLDKLKTEEQRKACYAKSRDKALSHMRSQAEKEIEQLFPTDQINVHNVIRLELDLYYPEQRIAIEFNGDYWHSLKFTRSSGLHLAKMAMCKNRNIKLINIFERDWNSLKTKSKLITLLSRNLTPSNFKAVEGEIKKVYRIKQQKFEDQYNLDKYEESQYCIGTYKGKELLNSVSYNIKDNTCVVTRFTTHSDYLEDYTELFKVIKSKHELPIIIKLDKRYYDSSLLDMNLFEYYKEVKPELFYVLNRKALRLNEASEEYLNNPRCYKVYDCGYDLYIY